MTGNVNDEEFQQSRQSLNNVTKLLAENDFLLRKSLQKEAQKKQFLASYQNELHT